MPSQCLVTTRLEVIAISRVSFARELESPGGAAVGVADGGGAIAFGCEVVGDALGEVVAGVFEDGAGVGGGPATLGHQTHSCTHL